MKRYIILSVNEDPEYLQYVPLTVWSWLKIGWEPYLFMVGDLYSPFLQLIYKTLDPLKGFALNPIRGYRSDTIAQVSRLYAAAQLEDDDLIMTGDVDMLALSPYWQPDPSVFTIYGYDLTNRNDVPICYVSATGKNWKGLMNINSSDINTLIKRDLTIWPTSGENIPWEKRWSADQQILTDRINHSPLPKQYIDRGRLSTGYAKRRIDRGKWTYDVLGANDFEYIDCHVHRDLYKASQDKDHQYRYKWEQHTDMINMLWSSESWDWYYKFMKQFAELAQ